MAIEQAVFVGTMMAQRELSQQHQEEIVRLTLDHLCTCVELGAEQEAAIAAATAAADAIAVATARIVTLQKQLGGGGTSTDGPRATCWLDAVGKARQSEAAAVSKAASAEADQAKLKTLMAEQQIGPRMRAKGAELLNAIGTASKAKIAAAGLEASWRRRRRAERPTLA